MTRKRIRDKLFAGITSLLCVLLLCERLTGEVCHVILGVLLMGMTAVHVGRHMRKIKYKKPAVQMVDMMLLFAFAVVLVTGILIHMLQEAFLIMILHKISSVVLVLGTIAHVLQHRKMC